MRNKMSDLNNHLMAAIERLSDESLPPEGISVEAERAKAIAGLASQSLQVGRLVLDAAKLQAEMASPVELPGMLTDATER